MSTEMTQIDNWSDCTNQVVTHAVHIKDKKFNWMNNFAVKKYMLKIHDIMFNHHILIKIKRRGPAE